VWTWVLNLLPLPSGGVVREPLPGAIFEIVRVPFGDRQGLVERVFTFILPRGVQLKP
jgi:hypothetical protein